MAENKQKKCKKEICEKVEKILSGLSLREKIGQLNQMYYRPDKVDDIIEAVKKGEVGSVILCSTAFAGSDNEKLAKDNPIDIIQKAAMESDTQIPIIFGKDVIHGHSVVLPIPLGFSCSFNFPLIEEAYKMIAEEAVSYGVRHTYAPMLDLSRDARWGRVAECPGEDPYVGEEVAGAIVRAFQGDGEVMNIAACAKHYLGYGASEGGRDYHRTEISDYSLRNYYLPAFRAAVREGVATVMASFNEISGEPVTGSRRLLTDMLREELGFDGFVISDWEAVMELIRHAVSEDTKAAAQNALNAGVDMDMISYCYIDNLQTLISEGKVSMDTLDEAVRRILKVKVQLGLFEKPYRSVKLTNGEMFDVKTHMAKARELARESMVLLKNDNNILPLDKNGKYAVMGPLLGQRKCLLGTWAPDGDAELVTTIDEALCNACPNIKIEDKWERVTGFYSMLGGYDTVILALGENREMSGESACLANIELPAMQVELIRHLKRINKKVIGVVLAGRPLALESVANDLDAIIYAWHSGTETANALADILFGDASPSGRLSMTIPRVTGQVPLYYNTTPSGRDCDEYYGIVSNIFTNYHDCLGSPLYPFGYGLSYTEFMYSDIETDKYEFTQQELKQGIELRVKVTNIGDYDSKEVVQCYIRDVVSSMARPIKELKAAQKTFIKKGETKEIVFRLTDKQLGFYNRDGEFTVESGKFYVYIGKDSLTTRKVTIEITD